MTKQQILEELTDTIVAMAKQEIGPNIEEMKLLEACEIISPALAQNINTLLIRGYVKGFVRALNFSEDTKKSADT